MGNRFCVRKDTATNWTAANPILLAGEIGAELDTGKWKLGDGLTSWNSLPYAVGAKGEKGDTGETGSQGPAGQGVPVGGTAKQILRKKSATDYDTEWISNTKSVLFYIDDVLKLETNVMSIIAPLGLTITEIRAAVDVAPTGANLIFDINKNGTTIYTTQANRPTITAGNTTVTATLPDVTSISLGDKISIDIDQIGSTLAGENLALTIICEVV